MLETVKILIEVVRNTMYNLIEQVQNIIKYTIQTNSI
jgi:hypothetical protein